jgi:hypothetical protein
MLPQSRRLLCCPCPILPLSHQMLNSPGFQNRLLKHLCVVEVIIYSHKTLWAEGDGISIMILGYSSSSKVIE